MRGCNQSVFAGSLCKIVLVTALSFLLTSTAIAQKAQTGPSKSPKYDLQTETKLKGVVDELKFPPKGSEKEIAFLMLKAGTETNSIFLCPKAFLDDMGIAVVKGDEITLTGSKVKRDGEDLILVRELVKGNDTFELRDEKGIPVW